MPLPSSYHPKKTRYLAWFLLSVALHVGGAFLLISLTTLPQLDFKLELPMDVEIGISEGQTLAAAPPLTVPPATPEAKPQIEQDTAAESDQGALDPPTPKAKKKNPKPTPPISHRKAQKALSKTFSQQGALISIRVQMEKVRESKLSDQVPQLLSAIPDWKLLLEGSQIDPLQDLDALLIASPNFSRSSLIIAGKHQGGVESVRRAAQRMAQARGKEHSWNDSGPIPTAAWYAQDPTPRIIASLGEAYFVICRQRDLTPFLSIALADDPQDDADSEDDEVQPALQISENLFSTQGKHALELQVEGARAFAGGHTKGIPTRLHATLNETADGQVHVNINGRFPSTNEAQTAHIYWQNQRDRFAQSPFVALMGLSALLKSTELSTGAANLKVKTVLESTQTRLLLNTLRNMLTPAQPPNPNTP